jgi:hypothetical protein
LEEKDLPHPLWLHSIKKIQDLIMGKDLSLGDEQDDLPPPDFNLTLESDDRDDTGVELEI